MMDTFMERKQVTNQFLHKRVPFAKLLPRTSRPRLPAELWRKIVGSAVRSNEQPIPYASTTVLHDRLTRSFRGSDLLREAEAKFWTVNRFALLIGREDCHLNCPFIFSIDWRPLRQQLLGPAQSIKSFQLTISASPAPWFVTMSEGHLQQLMQRGTQRMPNLEELIIHIRDQEIDGRYPGAECCELHSCIGGELFNAAYRAIRGSTVPKKFLIITSERKRCDTDYLIVAQGFVEGETVEGSLTRRQWETSVKCGTEIKIAM